MNTLRAILVMLIALLLTLLSPAHAHKPSDSYLSLQTEGRSIIGQWDIALRDLELAIGLDADGNGEATWDEVRGKHADIAAYSLSRLQLSASGVTCPARPAGHFIDNHSDGAYAVLRFTAECSAPIEALDIQYSLLFDLDPQHKGLLKLEKEGRSIAAIFSPDQMQRRFTDAEGGQFAQFVEYVKHGVWHIWIGFDHILFLLSLLLPAVLVLRDDGWSPSRSFKSSAVDVLKIVTAFTVAHSITLAAATFGQVQFSSRWIESLIAASVVLAALNNIFPIFRRTRWPAAFAFGLVHGFGFASVLGDLGLPADASLIALVGFNIGVELGQLAIVGVFLPTAFMLRQTILYRRFMVGGSALVALIACVWLAERSLDLTLLAA